jgi:hypothetical protein
MAGMKTLAREKGATGRPTPALGILYTVTLDNHLAIEEFLLRELDLAQISWVTIQMQNSVTESMGEAYSRLLESKFDLSSQRYWRSMLRSPEDFSGLTPICPGCCILYLANHPSRAAGQGPDPRPGRGLPPPRERRPRQAASGRYGTNVRLPAITQRAARRRLCPRARRPEPSPPRTPRNTGFRGPA